MSIQSNFKKAEEVINRQRIALNRRILWPDFEIYDLIATGMTFPEIQQQSSFPPFVMLVDLSLTKLVSPLDSKEYTHIAVTKRKQINEKMEVIETLYAFLTKRKIAIDQISCKFLHQKYRLDVQVAQLDRNNYFWGCEVLSDKVKVVSPRHIVKRNTTWIMEFQFDCSIRSFIFYSVERQPNYGKNYYGNYLPKDAIKESCMRYRTFDSIIDSYFKNKSEQLLESFGNSPVFISIKNIFTAPSHQQDEKQKMDNVSSVKCQSQNRNSVKQTKIVKVAPVEVTEPRRSIIDTKTHFEQMLLWIQKENSSVDASFTSLLSPDTESDFPELLNLLSQYQGFNHQDFDFKLHLLDKSIQLNLQKLQLFIFTHLLLDYWNQEEKSTNHWIKFYQRALKLHSKSLSEVGKLFLEDILKMKGHLILKNAQPLLNELKEVLGARLNACIEEVLMANYDNELIISDMLFVLMKIQRQYSIFTLYEKNKLDDHNLILGESISHWFELQGLPKNDEMNLKYSFEYEIPLKMTEYLKIQQKGRDLQKSQMFDDKYEDNLTITVEELTPYSIVCSKKFRLQYNSFQVYLLRKRTLLYCLIEETGFELPHHSHLSSFTIGIKLDVEGKHFQGNTNWSFTLPSHTAGLCFNIEQSSAISFALSISFRRNIVHQSILNFLRVRSNEMFKLPDEELKNQQNQRLAKRRSTIMLENLQDEFEGGSLELGCFFHERCELCCRLLRQQTIYNLSALDMYSILVSAPFQKQINCLLVLLKFGAIFESLCLKSVFLLSCLRLEYLSLNNVLSLFNSYGKDSSVELRMREVIQDKIGTMVKGALSDSKDRCMFSGKGRRFDDVLKFREEDFSVEYLAFTTSNCK